MFLVFSNYFDVLILEIIFKKLKNIINIHFNTKNYLKNNNNNTNKQFRISLLGGPVVRQGRLELDCHGWSVVMWDLNPFFFHELTSHHPHLLDFTFTDLSLWFAGKSFWWCSFKLKLKKN